MRILIVDDHEVVRRGLKQIVLEEFPDSACGEARESAQARELLTRDDWDLILLDINIPGRNGLELLEELHSLKPSLPVLILSAYPEQDFAVRALKLGAAGYLTKQSASDELIAAIRKTREGGKYVTLSIAEELARHLAGDTKESPHDQLSSRELQVLRLVAQGKSLKEIAAELSLSEKTIGTYRARISVKLGLSTSVELTRYAIQNKLVE